MRIERFYAKTSHGPEINVMRLGKQEIIVSLPNQL